MLFHFECVRLCCLNMFELLCITGFIMFYWFIYFLQWFAICSYLCGNYISSFRTLFFFSLCVWMLLTNQRLFFAIRQLPWMELPLFTWDPDSFAWFCICKEVHMSISMGLTLRKQGPWVLKFSRPTCNGRRWSKAELTGSERLISLSKGAPCESVPGVYLKYLARVLSLSLYIYIYTYMLSIYVYVATNKLVNLFLGFPRWVACYDCNILV